MSTFIFFSGRSRVSKFSICIKVILPALSCFVVASMFGCANFETRTSSRKASPAADATLSDEMNDEKNSVAGSEQKVAARFSIVDPSRWSNLETSKTGVVFAWTISGSSRLISDSGCRLRLRHRESGDTVLLKIDTKNQVSIQSLKPGTWDAKRLGCGLTRVWDVEGLFRDGFVVKNESVSLVGWFVFEFDERTLVTVREGGRQENTNLAMQIRSGWSGPSTLISGFSGKAIPMNLQPRDEIVRVKATGLKNSDQVLQPLLTRFQSCATQGMKVDPLRAGSLKMLANYKAGIFVGARMLTQELALRDDLLQCMRDAQETFTLPGAGDFTLETTY